ncbi:hypothetical protein KFU94_00755 [Chloroflexi bacterium TSY]|nr:hypothetical protein [Chloroflexi bacterium TSY]
MYPTFAVAVFFDQDIELFAPSYINLTAAVNDEEKREIAQIFQWLEKEELNALANRTYSHALLLNDSDDSQHGAGIWLTREVSLLTRQPDKTLLQIDENIPPEAIEIQSRWGDLSFEKRFGFNITDTTLLTTTLQYKFTWKTEPGDAEVDNANLKLEISTIDCRPNENEWSIDPLPGIHLLTKPYPGPCTDFNIFRFLPFFSKN